MENLRKLREYKQHAPGQRFGTWTVVREDGFILAGKKKDKRRVWLCRCDCGTERRMTYAKVLEAKMCFKCLGKMRIAKNTKYVIKIGDKFGSWVVVGDPVVSLVGKNHAPRKEWPCRCVCGTERRFVAASLVKAKTCYACFGRIRPDAHGHCRTQSQTAEYKAWASMISRCENEKDPGYRNYGGRGIKVSPRWRNSFKSFLADVGLKPTPTHQLGRIDNDGNYEPKNVEWQTPQENARNTRRNHLLTANGMTKTMAEWSAIYKIDTATMIGRIKLGWSEQDVVTKPVGKSGPKAAPRFTPFGFTLLQDSLPERHRPGSVLA